MGQSQPTTPEEADFVRERLEKKFSSSSDERLCRDITSKMYSLATATSIRGKGANEAKARARKTYFDSLLECKKKKFKMNWCLTASFHIHNFIPPPLHPDWFVKEIVEEAKKSDDLRYLADIGEFGSRVMGIIPTLEKLMKSDDELTARGAFRAKAHILALAKQEEESKKPKK
jgi:hypothetical protein